VAMTIVWGWSLPIAFTWYVFIGAATTVSVAPLVARAVRRI
jgi:hypothetical protein